MDGSFQLKRKASEEDNRPSKKFKPEDKFTAIVTTLEYEQDASPILVMVSKNVMEQYKPLFRAEMSLFAK
jgi:hypothetical protein